MNDSICYIDDLGIPADVKSGAQMYLLKARTRIALDEGRRRVHSIISERAVIHNSKKNVKKLKYPYRACCYPPQMHKDDSGTWHSCVALINPKDLGPMGEEGMWTEGVGEYYGHSVDPVTWQDFKDQWKRERGIE